MHIQRFALIISFLKNVIKCILLIWEYPFTFHYGSPPKQKDASNVTTNSIARHLLYLPARHNSVIVLSVRFCAERDFT